MKERALLVLFAAVAAAILALSSGSGPSEADHQRTRAYLALGDSLGVGAGASDPAGKGYVALFHQFLISPEGLGSDLALVNYSAGATTTTSFIEDQLPLAVAELEARNGDSRERNDVEAVTIDVGGNDMVGLLSECAGASSLECVNAALDALAAFEGNLDFILGELRAAAGPDTPIVVMTYYNPLVNLRCPLSALAPLAGLALEGSAFPFFPLGLNDLIRSVAADHDATVADLIPGGDFPSLLRGVNLRPDCVHPNDSGHRIIADEFARAFQAL